MRLVNGKALLLFYYYEMHKIQQKRRHNFFCYIYRGPVTPVTPPPPPPTPPTPPPPINDNEQQLIDDIQAALNAFWPQKEASDACELLISEEVERKQMTYQEEHQFRLSQTDLLLNILLNTHISAMTSLMDREVALDVRTSLLKYMFNQISDIEEKLVDNVNRQVYGLRTDIGDLWTRFVAQHNALKALIGQLEAGDKPGGEDVYNPDDNQTDSSAIRDGLQSLIDDFLDRITRLTDEAVAKLAELEAMFLIDNIPEDGQSFYRRQQTNMNYGMLNQYSGWPEDSWGGDPTMNGFLTHFSPFNLAERNALKLLYNEEDILFTIFKNRRLIPPSQSGVLFEDEHVRMKGIIDNAAVG
jgi:hypothetical protein